MDVHRNRYGAEGPPAELGRALDQFQWDIHTVYRSHDRLRNLMRLYYGPPSQRAPSTDKRRAKRMVADMEVAAEKLAEDIQGGEFGDRVRGQDGERAGEQADERGNDGEEEVERMGD